MRKVSKKEMQGRGRGQDGLLAAGQGRASDRGEEVSVNPQSTAAFHSFSGFPPLVFALRGSASTCTEWSLRYFIKRVPTKRKFLPTLFSICSWKTGDGVVVVVVGTNLGSSTPVHSFLLFPNAHPRYPPTQGIAINTLYDDMRSPFPLSPLHPTHAVHT